MKQKKVLLRLSIVLLLILLVFAQMFILFSVNNVEIERMNAFNRLNEKDIYSYASSQLMSKNNLFLSKSDIDSTLTSKYPYAKVEHIEKAFPSTIILKITERLPLYAIKANEKYYIFDIEGVLLDIKIQNEQQNFDEYPCVEISGIEIDDNLMIKGAIPKLEGIDKSRFDVLGILFYTLNNLEESYVYSENQIKTFIKSVTITQGFDLSIQTRYGLEILIYGSIIDGKLVDEQLKIRYAIGVFCQNTLMPYGKLIILNTKNASGNYEVQYISKENI